MKRVADSSAEINKVLRYQHLNHHRRLFGGALMQWIDEIAGLVAMRHSERAIITAAVDQLVFKRPAYLGEIVTLRGRITYIGHTSMEVRVDTYAQALGEEERSINRAYLVMVAVDEEGRPVEVPGLDLVSDEERREWAAGEKRSQLRNRRREERF